MEGRHLWDWYRIRPLRFYQGQDQRKHQTLWTLEDLDLLLETSPHAFQTSISGHVFSRRKGQINQAGVDFTTSCLWKDRRKRIHLLRSASIARFTPMALIRTGDGGNKKPPMHTRICTFCFKSYGDLVVSGSQLCEPIVPCGIWIILAMPIFLIRWTQQLL